MPKLAKSKKNIGFNTDGKYLVVYADHEELESWESSEPLRAAAPVAWAAFEKKKLPALVPAPFPRPPRRRLPGAHKEKQAAFLRAPQAIRWEAVDFSGKWGRKI